MKKIILSRTDSIGDVILTLPMAGVLKKHFTECKIYFLGRSYTRPIIEACQYVDEFVEYPSPSPSPKREGSIQQTLFEINADIIIHAFPVKEICQATKKAGIPLRIGTSHRWYSWLYCNKLLHFSRKNSDLHESQLNLKMLEALGIHQEYSLKEIPNYYGLTKFISSAVHQFISSPGTPHLAPPHASITPPLAPPQEGRGIFNLILHPKSKGSAREWGLDNFSHLIELLPQEKFGIFITGTKEEGALMTDFLNRHLNRVTDLTGKMTLAELIAFINACDGIVAASTGPLHIAAALGKHAIGLYAPMKPIHPKRWAPVGLKSDFLVLDKKCNDCRHSQDCACIRSIKPEEVAVKLKIARGEEKLT